MDGVVTEKKYPIRNIWLFKQILPIFSIFLGLFIVSLIPGIIFDKTSGVAFFLLVIASPVIFMFILLFGTFFIIKVLRRSNFHYSLDENFMVFRQGVISKQNRSIPYGVIQGVFVNQGFFDRIFGLASLTIEDFSQGGLSAMNVDGYVLVGDYKHEVIGFMGNKIHIPGLKKVDAEELKAIILQKVKENPIENSQSGL